MQIKLKNGTTLEVTPDQQAKLAILFMSKPNARTEIAGTEFRIGDITNLNEQSLKSKFEQQGLNMEWYIKKPPTSKARN